jgi:hypothetical protein
MRDSLDVVCSVAEADPSHSSVVSQWHFDMGKHCFTERRFPMAKNHLMHAINASVDDGDEECKQEARFIVKMIDAVYASRETPFSRHDPHSCRVAQCQGVPYKSWVTLPIGSLVYYIPHIESECIGDPYAGHIFHLGFVAYRDDAKDEIAVQEVSVTGELGRVVRISSRETETLKRATEDDEIAMLLPNNEAMMEFTVAPTGAPANLWHHGWTLSPRSGGPPFHIALTKAEDTSRRCEIYRPDSSFVLLSGGLSKWHVDMGPCERSGQDLRVLVGPSYDPPM